TTSIRDAVTWLAQTSLAPRDISPFVRASKSSKSFSATPEDLDLGLGFNITWPTNTTSPESSMSPLHALSSRSSDIQSQSLLPISQLPLVSPQPSSSEFMSCTTGLASPTFRMVVQPTFNLTASPTFRTVVQSTFNLTASLTFKTAVQSTFDPSRHRPPHFSFSRVSEPGIPRSAPLEPSGGTSSLYCRTDTTSKNLHKSIPKQPSTASRRKILFL
ncbi:hypothetical protein U1Q18_032513, partial [Sarracenia purpurea var. burkii]